LHLGNQQGFSIYLRGFISLLLINVAIYVALNLSDPGFIKPTPYSRQACGDATPRDMPSQEGLRQVDDSAEEGQMEEPSIQAQPVTNIEDAFDLGRLLQSKQASELGSGAVLESHSPECEQGGLPQRSHAEYSLNQEQPDSHNDNGQDQNIASAEEADCRRGLDTDAVQSNDSGADPGSILLRHLSNGLAGQQCNVGLGTNDRSAANQLGCWADVLPISATSTMADRGIRAGVASPADGQASAVDQGLNTGASSPGPSTAATPESAAPIRKFQARSEDSSTEIDLIAAVHVSSDAIQASSM
jgi:hypothetical protein